MAAAVSKASGTADEIVPEGDLGRLVIEGKTKIVREIKGVEHCVHVLSKDSISAGDGARRDELAGKAEIANATTCSIFTYLQKCGVPTHFVRQAGPRAFIAEACEMVPIEFVTRRLATGSYLRRHKTPFPIAEGHVFAPPLLEFFYKDDANHDPQVTREQILAADPKVMEGVTAQELERMETLSVLVFELLERAWRRAGCALVDMKVEFGRTMEGEVVLADVIDNDAWRVWPNGDPRLMKDKQVYRNFKEVTPEGLQEVLRNYAWVAERVASFDQPTPAQVVVLTSEHHEDEVGEDVVAVIGALRHLNLTVTSHVVEWSRDSLRSREFLASLDASTSPVVAVILGDDGLDQFVRGHVAIPSIFSSELDDGLAIAVAKLVGAHCPVAWGTMRAMQVL